MTRRPQAGRLTQIDSLTIPFKPRQQLNRWPQVQSHKMGSIQARTSRHPDLNFCQSSLVRGVRSRITRPRTVHMTLKRWELQSYRNLASLNRTPKLDRSCSLLSIGSFRFSPSVSTSITPIPTSTAMRLLFTPIFYIRQGNLFPSYGNAKMFSQIADVCLENYLRRRSHRPLC